MGLSETSAQRRIRVLERRVENLEAALRYVATEVEWSRIPKGRGALPPPTEEELERKNDRWAVLGQMIGGDAIARLERDA